MKIEHVIFPFLGSEIGGSHVSSFTLARQLQAEGIRCTILCVGDSAVASEARSEGLNVESSGEPPTARNNPIIDLLRLPRRISRLRPLELSGTLIHCNDIATLQAWILPARIAHVPIIYHHRSVNRMLLPNRKLIEYADGTISISNECSANVSFLPNTRVRQIMNPFSIDVSVNRCQARADLLRELQLPTDIRLFGFVGNFWERKRPVFFLEVAVEIARIDPRARFILFGRDGDTTSDNLKQHAERLGIGPLTFFPGFRRPGERNIAALDVMIATAVREPFGRTIVEALLVGTPYVATDDAGHRESARRWAGGLLAPEGAPAPYYASHALSLLEENCTIALCDKDREKVAQEVSPVSHTRSVIQFYNDLLASSPPNHA